MTKHAPACPAFRYPGIAECNCGGQKTRPKSSWELRAEQAETERDMLREALVGLVGVDGREDLEQMEGVMRLMSAPTADKVATINAIHSLLATLKPEPTPERTEP